MTEFRPIGLDAGLWCGSTVSQNGIATNQHTTDNGLHVRALKGLIINQNDKPADAIPGHDSGLLMPRCQARAEHTRTTCLQLARIVQTSSNATLHDNLYVKSCFKHVLTTSCPTQRRKTQHALVTCNVQPILNNTTQGRQKLIARCAVKSVSSVCRSRLWKSR